MLCCATSLSPFYRNTDVRVPRPTLGDSGFGLKKSSVNLRERAGIKFKGWGFLIATTFFPLTPKFRCETFLTFFYVKPQTKSAGTSMSEKT